MSRRLFTPAAGSTAQLGLFAGLYFFLYTLFGLGVKYAQSPAIDGYPGLTDLEFLVYSTLGSATVCLGVILIARWWKFRWRRREIFYMFLSGTCTALLVPTTTLMYSLPISVMVAMVLMRGSIIVVSRLVDTVLLAQGLSHKKVRWEENVAVLISLGAVGVYLFFARDSDFDFTRSSAARWILGIYILGYAARIYLMNYFKFTRSEAALATNKNYFAVEQLSASFWIFMFQGRTSTFAGLVNRLTSLVAGTFATLLFALFFAGKWPKPLDWISLGFILVAVLFLARAEVKDRRAGLVKKI
ncbi:MAG: hypothetical protein EOP11_09985 [Proteobacteria bacterium]|nr:MAG: hypothetical protein EOP11_09985 [Pseudomonadota bacterium]